MHLNSSAEVLRLIKWVSLHPLQIVNLIFWSTTSMDMHCGNLTQVNCTSLACRLGFESELGRSWDSQHLLLCPGQPKHIILPAEPLNGFCGELETNGHDCHVAGSVLHMHEHGLLVNEGTRKNILLLHKLWNCWLHSVTGLCKPFKTVILSNIQGTTIAQPPWHNLVVWCRIFVI